jgi:hypothetical protein
VIGRVVRSEPELELEWTKGRKDSLNLRPRLPDQFQCSFWIKLATVHQVCSYDRCASACEGKRREERYVSFNSTA